MKKRGKRILPLILSVGCLLAASVPVMAEEIDPDRTGSVSLQIRAYATDDVVGGGSLNLYQIADTTVTVYDGASYHYTTAFSGCDEDLLTEDALAKAETADIFCEWVDTHSVAARTTVTVSSDGSAQFTNLSCGLYLITQNRAAEGYNPINAFLVSVPRYKDGSWIYDVDATPKTSPATQVVPESQQVESGSKPAKTGDYNPYLYGALIVGAAAVIVVVLRRRTRRVTE